MGSITRGIANNILGSGAVDGTDGLTGTIPADNIANASTANLTSFPPSVDAGIPVVTSNPSPVSEGDVWYNSSINKLRVQGTDLSGSSWSSGGSLNTARASVDDGSCGVQGAAIVMGGGNPQTANCEEYDGSSWTEVNNLNTARREGAAAGNQEACIFFTGRTGSFLANNESFNGTSWTEVGDTNVSTIRSGGAGTQTAALRAGGGPPYQSTTEKWDGSSWTEVNDMNNARCTTGVGLQTAMLVVAGEIGRAPAGYRSSHTENWDGTSWTELADCNVTTSFSNNFGTQNLAIDFGGNGPAPSKIATAEFWDGTSWTEPGDMASALSERGSAGVSGLGLAIGGNAPGNNASCEEWTAGTGVRNVTLTAE